MKKVIVLSIALMFLTACGTTSKMFGGGSQPTAAAPKQLPETVKNEFDKGVKAYQNEQYVNAEEAFRNVIRIDPNIPEAHMDLALALYKQGKTDQGDKELQAAQRMLSRSSGLGGSRSGTAPHSSENSGTQQNSNTQ